MTDDEIIDLYWQRNEIAIKRSAECFGRFCHKIAMNILSNLQDAEECVNDTWYRAWQSIPPQRPRSLVAYFGRITRNISISKFRADHAKKRYDGITILLSELDDCIPDKSSFEKEREDRQMAEILSRWLAELPVDDRILFVKRYWMGDPVKTLAKEGGVTQNQMAQRMFRLRKDLKNRLEAEVY